MTECSTSGTLPSPTHSASLGVATEVSQAPAPLYFVSGRFGGVWQAFYALPGSRCTYREAWHATRRQAALGVRGVLSPVSTSLLLSGAGDLPAPLYFVSGRFASAARCLV